MNGINEPTTDNFWRQGLLSRRFAQAKGFVQVSQSYKWDHYGEIAQGSRKELSESRKVHRQTADGPEAARAAEG